MAARKRRRSLPRRIARGLGLSLLGVVTLLALAVGWLHTRSGQDFVRRRIEQAAGERLNGSLGIGRLDFALGGSIELDDVTLSDAAGAPVARLGMLRVKPRWGRLLRGEIALAEVTVHGLSLGIVQYPDGGSNLSRLGKPRPPEPEPAKPARKPTVHVERLAIDDVSVTLDKPDGTRLALSKLGIAGRIDLVSETDALDVTLEPIAAELELDKPVGDGSGRLHLGVTGFETALGVSVQGPARKLSLGPTRAHLALGLPDRAARTLDVALGPVTIGLGPGGLDATLRQLRAGVALLESLDVRGNLADGQLAGSQHAALAGLHLDAGALNALLERPLLASDLDLVFGLDGAPDHLVLHAALDTRGGKVVLDGEVDASDLERAGYSLSLSVNDLSSERLLGAAAAKLPPFALDRLLIRARGHGMGRDDAQAELTLEAEGGRVAKLPIKRIDLTAHLDRGTVTIDQLLVELLEQKLGLHGRMALASRELDLELDPELDAGRALAQAERAGLPVHALLGPGVLRVGAGELRVTARGPLDGALEVAVMAPHLAVGGGTVGIEAHATLDRSAPRPEGKPFELRGLAAELQVHGVSARALATMLGRKPPDEEARLDGRVSLHGSLDDPEASFGLRARLEPHLEPQAEDEMGEEGTAPASPAAPVEHAAALVELKGTLEHGQLRATVTADRLAAGGAARMADVSLALPLALGPGPKGLRPDQPLDVHLRLPERPLGELTSLLPPSWHADRNFPAKGGAVALALDLAGTAARPEGHIGLDLSAHALGASTQRLRVDATIGPASAGQGSVVHAQAEGWLDRAHDRTLKLDAEASLGRSPLLAPAGPRTLTWRVGADIAPLDLQTLPVALGDLSGRVGAHIALTGGEQDVGGEVRLTADGLRKGKLGPASLEARLGIAPERTTVEVDGALGALELLKVRGGVGLGGRGLLARARDPLLLAVPLDLTVDVPRHKLAELKALAEQLEGKPGELDAHFEVGGNALEPTLKGRAAVSRVPMANGGLGQAALELEAGLRKISAKLGLGAPSAEGGPLPVRIDAELLRTSLRRFLRSGDPLELELGGHAEHVDLRRLLPAFAVEATGIDPRGTLDLAFDGRLTVRKDNGQIHLEHGTLDGSLGLGPATIGLPGTKRSFHDVTLRLSSNAEGLRIDTLSLRESDREKAVRKLDAHGLLRWHDLAPESLELELGARDWLVFGGSMGEPDAPRAALSLDASVHGKLAAPLRRVDVDVSSLELLAPERFERAHQPEVVSVGDVIFVSKPAEIGRLPLPPSVAAKAVAASAGAAPAAASAGAAPAAASGEPEHGLDLVVHLPKPIHALQPPLDLRARGEVAIHMRPTGRSVQGELTAIGGALALGGRDHELDKGRIWFDTQCPKGCLDLYFHHPLGRAGLQDVSLASAGGDAVRIHMFGPLDNRTTVLSGAASPGTLFDLLSAHNASHSRYVSEPDLPATEAVQFPQYTQLLVVGYLAVNLPHMLFLDRFTGWADAYDSPGSYGHIEHYEGQRYLADGKLRLDFEARPPTPGMSQAEVGLHYLLTDPDSRALFGVGVTAGSRLGGGPGLVFEWSSDE